MLLSARSFSSSSFLVVDSTFSRKQPVGVRGEAWDLFRVVFVCDRPRAPSDRRQGASVHNQVSDTPCSACATENARDGRGGKKCAWNGVIGTPVVCISIPRSRGRSYLRARTTGRARRDHCATGSRSQLVAPRLVGRSVRHHRPVIRAHRQKLHPIQSGAGLCQRCVTGDWPGTYA